MRRVASIVVRGLVLTCGLACGLTSGTAFAQIVVGGSPNKDWENSAMKLWLRADAGVTETSGTVTSWADQSNSGYTASLAAGTNSPQYNATLVNGAAGIAFDRSGAATGAMGVDASRLGGASPMLAIAVGNFANEPTSLYCRPIGEAGPPRFADDSIPLGLSAATRPALTFGLLWADLDGDGVEELVAVEQVEDPTAEGCRGDGGRQDRSAQVTQRLAAEGPVPVAALRKRAPSASGPVQRVSVPQTMLESLQERGLLRLRAEVVQRDPLPLVVAGVAQGLEPALRLGAGVGEH